MTTLLVDGDNILARSDYAAKGRHVEMSVDGVNTAALLIFVNLLSKYVRLVRPDRMVVCWDAGRGLRTSFYPEYKAKRIVAASDHNPDVPYDPGPVTPRKQALQFCTWAGIPHTSRHGWEADDVIAAFCATTPGPKVILSGDKDLLQLVGPDTVQIRPGDAKGEWWDLARFEGVYGFEPTAMPLYMALVGDPVDGVLGVRGIGPKKAVKALEEAGWDWSVLLDLLGPERAQEAVTARRLVDLVYPTFAAYADDWAHTANQRPAPEVVFTGPDGPLWLPLLEFLDRWRMATVTQRLTDGFLWHDDPAEPTGDGARAAFADYEV